MAQAGNARDQTMQGMPPPRNVQELLRACRREGLLEGMEQQHRERNIRGLSEDSRSIEAGFLFAAFAGARQDGRDFIADALECGASAVLTRPDVPPPKNPGIAPVWLAVEEPRSLFARMAAAFHPGRPRRVVAVTGTNGKTSCVWFLRQLWDAMHLPAAGIGTLGVCAPSWLKNVAGRGGESAFPGTAAGSAKHMPEANLTTLAPVSLHRLLHTLAQEGITRVALEASSHGLAQHRLDGLLFDAAAFTSFSQDHLDYHHNMEAYAQAKLRLFAERLSPGAVAVLNADMPLYARARAVATDASAQVVSVGFADDADFVIKNLVAHGQGQRFMCAYQGSSHLLDLPMIGAFQAHNAVTAAALAIAEGCAPKEVFALFSSLDSVPGRLQEAGHLPNGAKIHVDYAHTPDALAKLLDAVRPHVQGKLRLVFGCGGERDRSKRPCMGAMAADKADHVIVTDDNPRGEDAAAIRSEILAACPRADEEGDRRNAIRQGVAALCAGDILVIAGKGHERFQLLGDERIPFCDVTEARAAIAALQEGDAP